MRRSPVRRAVAVLGLLAVAGAAVVTVPGGGSDPAAVRPDTVAETAVVERRDLVATERLSGTLGYGPASPIVAPRGGRLTARPDPGTVVGRGGVLYEVDGAGVELFLGTRPFWRPLAVGVPTGPDVRQLEENLVALAAATGAQLTVDETFTDATAAALRRWQRARNRPETGTFDPSDAAVHPTEIRVHEVTVVLGAAVAPGAPIAEVTSSAEQVTAAVDAHDVDLVAAGTEVVVESPDGSRIPGRVSSVAAAEADPDDAAGREPSFVASIAVDVPGERARDRAPVTVHVADRRATGVLTVPVEALLASAGGRYSLERLGDHGSEVVPVQLGVVADGLVEVSGALAPGDRVVVAAA